MADRNSCVCSFIPVSLCSSCVRLRRLLDEAEDEGDGIGIGIGLLIGEDDSEGEGLSFLLRFEVFDSKVSNDSA